MPLLAIATTLPQIEDAFRTAMEATTPRMTRSQTSAWKHWARDHQPAMGTRWFRIEWDTAGTTDQGFMWRGGASQDVTCTIVVDYGGIPAEDRDEIIQDDYQQLWDVLDNLRNTTNGLRRVRGETWGLDEGTDDQAQYALVYRVSYLQARAS